MSATPTSDQWGSISCPICLNYYLEPASRTPTAAVCLHNICSECFIQLPTKSCPICRESIDAAATNTDVIKIIEDIRTLILTPPERITPSPDDAAMLPDVITKATTFLNKTWAPDSSHANHLTQDNLTLLWNYDPELCEKVLIQLYSRLEIFYTEACTVSNTFKGRSADVIYKNLCRLGAVSKAADQGIDVAAFCYGYCLYNGIGCSKNPEGALHYLNLAAERKLPLALLWLGHYYEAVKKYPTAFGYYEAAAAQNNMDSFVSLAQCYFTGKGVVACPIKAIENLKIAAEQGHMDALILLGDYYSKKDPSYNNGGDPDLELALEYYVRALSRGHDRAQEEIHRCNHLQRSTNSGSRCTHQ